MEIQKMRYGDTFSYEIHAEEGTENIRIPPILIQTFIENAIKHSNTFDEPIIIRTDIAVSYTHLPILSEKIFAENTKYLQENNPPFLQNIFSLLRHQARYLW